MRAQTSEPRPWEPLLREGGEAFAAFRAYLELGPGRSIPAAARVVGKSKQLLWGWSARYQWVQRAKSWDAHMARQRDEELADARRELTRRRLRRADMLDRVGEALVGRFFRRDPFTGELQSSPEVKPRDAVPLLRLATQLEERLDIAGPEGDTALSADERLQGLNDRELERLIELVQAADETGATNKEDDRDDPASEDEA